MKYILSILLLVLSNISFAQNNFTNINDEVEVLDSVSAYNTYIYNDISNTLDYNMYFFDTESFLIFTHFKSIDEIFEDKLENLHSSGVISKLISLGIKDVTLHIKNEKSGDILTSRVLDLYNIQSSIGLSATTIKENKAENKPI